MFFHIHPLICALHLKIMIVEVTPNSSAEIDWLHLPFDIYKEDKNWIPHLLQDVQKVFDPNKNKLYQTGKAIRWVLYRNNQPIGRIAAFHFPKLSAKQEHRIGGLGFFECINEQSAANLLFERAIAWLKEEGCEAVDGPINFGERDAFWGLLTENFTDMSSYKMNYNPPYYQALFESFGFKNYFEQYCFKRSLDRPTAEVFEKKQSELIKDAKFKVSNARGMKADKIASDFCTVYNNAWAGIAGFKPMELAQAQQVVKAMKPIMDRDIVIFAYYDGHPIGFYVSIPELNEIFQHINGNLNWWGKIKFLFYKYFGKKEVMVGLVFGVDRAYHGRGVESALIKFGEQTIIPMGRYKHTILTWIGDFNPKMLKVASNLDAKKYRVLITYRLYFDASIPFKRCEVIK